MRWSWVVMMSVMLAACSGGDSVTTDPAPVGSTAAISELSTTTVPAPRVGEPTASGESGAVSIEAEIDGKKVEFTGELTGAADPFGDFVSCSGGRVSFATYSLLASRSSGDVRSLSVTTDDLVAEPGIHDATIRVELAGGDALGATGTMSLDDGFRTGSFTAFTDDGALVSGSFECGVGPSPAPLVIGKDDGRLEAVDAVALLRDPRGERLVGLAAEADSGAVVQCPAADGVGGDVVVRVDGDAAVGSITSLELTDGSPAVLRMRVGAVEYEFEDVTVSVAGSAGTFSAVGDVSVDGAWRCS